MNLEQSLSPGIHPPITIVTIWLRHVIIVAVVWAPQSCASKPVRLGNLHYSFCVELQLKDVVSLNKLIYYWLVDV